MSWRDTGQTRVRRGDDRGDGRFEERAQEHGVALTGRPRGQWGSRGREGVSGSEGGQRGPAQHFGEDGRAADVGDDQREVGGELLPS